jgi:hypothetical protein
MRTIDKPKNIFTTLGGSKELPARAKRSRCRIMATMAYLGNSTPVKIVDVSATGVALDLAGPFRGTRGSKVRVECPEFGALEGMIRWMRDGRAGLEFDPSSNAAAQVTAYFRFYHKETAPVLRR